MNHPAAYPGHFGPRRLPRRARRGLSALLAVIFLAALLSAALVSWHATLAAERVRGQARHLAEVVAAEGYALHHWLHEARAGTGFSPPAQGTARALTATGSSPELARLAGHSATTPWRRSSSNSRRVILPRGWSLTHLVGQVEGTDLPDGLVVLRPSSDRVSGPDWEIMARALDVLLGSGAQDAETLAAAASLAPAFDATRDRVVFASRFSRLDTHAVLRRRHAGTGLPSMEADLDLGGNALETVTHVSADRATVATLTGECAAPAGALCADHLTTTRLAVQTGIAQLASVDADRATFTGAVSVTGLIASEDASIRTGNARITGTLTTPHLTACTDPTADLCGGGDLDFENTTGTPDWTAAAIFGDVIIRDGNRLTGITTTTAHTGIFGGITGPPVLDVDECFRSVTPFVHGAGC